MREWWTYSAEDFLLFSSRSYWRLIERHNEALWPAQIMALLVRCSIRDGTYKDCRARMG
jgi:hypothetical protein